LMAELASEIAAMLKPAIETKPLMLEVAATTDYLMARADRDRVTQVLTNLLTNAVKFTPSGGKITVRLEPSADDNWLQVSVTDTGCGIRADEVERIFDEFYQSTQPRRQKTGGVGLGLAICKRLVEMNGGSIWVESTEGQGSSFYFTVPAAQAHDRNTQ
jgi:signal transduction histidine kinase